MTPEQIQQKMERWFGKIIVIPNRDGSLILTTVCYVSRVLHPDQIQLATPVSYKTFAPQEIITLDGERLDPEIASRLLALRDQWLGKTIIAQTQSQTNPKDTFTCLARIQGIVLHDKKVSLIIITKRNYLETIFEPDAPNLSSHQWRITKVLS